MDLGLADRVVLLTGATRGIGLATARAFAAEGARVVLTYRRGKAEADALVAELGGPERALAVRYALDEPGSPEQAVAEASRRWGGVDALVANAYRRGGRRPASERFEEVPAEEWRAVLTDNLAGTVRTAQLVLPGMRERGWGRVVLISSHIATHGRRGQEVYGAAKAALHGLTRSLAWEAGADGVLVNVVAPGLTLTEGVLEMLPEALREQERERTPTARLSEPDSVARAVVFLSSAANSNISGQVLHVDGGR
ncbi:SDR family oxidoreductase [Kitasatospora sp. NBC_01250]|uniref:SDR family NAD(P)-dependent oxidoreductase n=1 Tax=Kitasatospora sp. NBC_01250 TaxID=2903571 RepID=UPI002E2EE999|nr:SDR family NAD(P)-dependent oxidoreductase [Kitasatospora sp. NBC_01250]